MSFFNQWIRIFYKDDTNIVDLSLKAQNDETIPFDFVSAEDKLYIAQDLAFNNFFIQLDTPNAVQANMTIEVWEGKAWQPVVDIIDGTNTQAFPAQTTPTPFSIDGVVQFVPNREEFWRFVDDTTDEPAAFGLQSDLTVYNKYWLRVGFDTDLTVGTIIKKIGYAFCDDRQLTAIDPEIDNFLTSWASGKTNWIEQILIASEHVVSDLKSRSLIEHQGEILRFEDISLATAYRTLALIYSKFGKGYETQRDDAMARYAELSAISRFSFDKNSDGQLDKGEFQGTTGTMVR